jgi:hypothetical protein
MSSFPLLKGTKLRATKINSCGMPIAGPANRMVTDAFVTVTLTAVNRDANDIEQANAEGKVCVADRTPPTRKYYTAAVELCQVNTGIISLFSGWPQVLNYADDPVGFRDSANVDTDYGVALEVWTSGRSEEDCPPPDTDAILASPTSGRKYGYFLFGGIEWSITSDLTIAADVNTITLSGMTVPMTQWGRGPYNVVETAPGVAGRLLHPFTKDPHVHVERTPIAPPPVTPGSEPVPLAINSVFSGTSYYYGGPAGAAPINVAPAQPVGSTS